MKFLKEPLLHFLLLGMLIFVVFGWQQGSVFAGSEVRVTAVMQQNMGEVFRRTWQRPPTQYEMDGLIKDRVREELAYREAAAMGLDQDDIIIRRRLRQKLEMLAEDVATLNPPTDAELQTWYREHADDYLIPAKYTLKQIYISLGPTPEETRQRSLSLLARLLDDERKVDIKTAGDPIMLPQVVRSASVAEIERSFGAQFLDAVVKAPVGQWSGPAVSGFGLHLIKVEESIDAAPAEFADVRAQLARDWLAEQKLKALDEMYAGFAENYSVIIESQDQP